MRKATPLLLSAALFFVPLLSPAGAAPRLSLHPDQSGPIILLSTEGSRQPETRAATLSTASYLHRITGAQVPVVVEGKGLYRRAGRNWRIMPFQQLKKIPAGRPEIHIGLTSKSAEVLGHARIEKLDMDGFVIKTTADAVFLAGARDWSTAYACFTFLEDFCGVRWYLPGEFGEEVPNNPGLAVPVTDCTYEPAYQHRQYSGFQWRDGRELVLWGKHNRIRPRLYYHHNLYHIFDVKKYGKKYPDLYPIIKGRRRIPGPKTIASWQPCLTHPRAVDIAMDYARDIFAKDPNRSSISLGITDGAGYCECERCMKLVDPNLPDEAKRSVWFFQFANKVAAQFDREFPDKLIGYLLYGQCKQFPPGMKINPRLIGFFVAPSYRLITREGQEKFEAGVKELTKSVSHFGLYDWFYGDGLCIPRLQIRQAKQYLAYGYKMGARHLKAEAYMNWGLDGFKYWMHSKLLWDPSLDVDEMMDDFFSGFFKEAAEPMREYFRVVEEYSVKPVLREYETEEGPKTLPVNFRFRRPEQLESFPPEAALRCVPFLDAAERKAHSFIVRDRVRYFRNAFEVARIMTERYHLSKQVTDLIAQNKMPEGLHLLARAMSPDLDVEQFYKWVLRGDDFCVRHPPPTMFGGLTSARRAAATALSAVIIHRLKMQKERLTLESLKATTHRVLDSSLAEIADKQVRDTARLAVAPMASKIILCPRAKAPAIDGRLDDAGWRKSRFISDFAILGTGKPAVFVTRAKLIHDGRNLYIGAVGEQDTSTLLAWTKERDGRLWREDSMEFLLNLPSARKVEDIFQLIVNTNGNIFDYYNGTDKWNGDIKVGVHKEPQAYSLEISIPLEPIGIDLAKDRFLRFNLVRNVFTQKRARGIEHLELSTWYLTDASNRDPKARGWLILQ